MCDRSISAYLVSINSTVRLECEGQFFFGQHTPLFGEITEVHHPWETMVHMQVNSRHIVIDVPILDCSVQGSPLA